MKTFTSLTATALLSVLALNAAQAADTPKSVTVEFADLNLRSDQGAATLYGRIRGAAKDVCRDHSGTTLLDKVLYRNCIEFAVGNAVAEVNSPVLTSYVANLSSNQKAPVRVASGR